MQSRILNGRYEIFTPLGQGGMATVYRGRDVRLGRPVAIKLLHSYYATDDEFLQRFAHEAMSAAHLSSHPNIVDVYDVGQENDQNYIVMELIEGDDLKTVIERQAPLPPERALTIAAQVADGLDYAHRRGLVHRDVKPQNILITPDGQVRIADFGIAKSHLSTAVTQTGMTFGTADYISPEQAQGRTATPQSDLYSLGVVLFEMLTGRLPFMADTPMAVAIQHIQQPPPSPRQFNPSVPPTLEALVLQTLAKDPQQRPDSARTFAQQLRDYLAGRLNQTVVAPVAPPVRQPEPTYRQPVQPQERRTPPQGLDPARRPVQRPRPQYAAPPLATAPPRDRGGVGFGTLLIGLLLLAGVLTLAYLALNSDVGSLFDFSTSTDPAASAQASAPGDPTAAAVPTGTAQPTVAVPELVGRPEAEANAEIERLGLIRNPSPDPAFAPRNDPAPVGTVIEQDPAPGTQVPPGTQVTIIISLGPAVADVPDVTQRRAQDAQNTLQAAGFTVQQQQEPSTSVPAGVVIRQEPQAGVRVPTGEQITLVVSAGDVVAFPNVVANGTLLDQAQQQIEGAGFNVVAVDAQGPDRLSNFNSFQPNEVVSATAANIPIDAPGKLVPRGADVIIAVRAPNS